MTTKIAKKIYYDLTTGNVIQEIGEREGSVRETSIAEDFVSYTALAERAMVTVGVLQLAYGQDRDKFGVFAYHIDTITQGIVWELTPIQIEEQAIAKTLAEKVTVLEEENALLKANQLNLEMAMAEMMGM